MCGIKKFNIHYTDRGACTPVRVMCYIDLFFVKNII